MHRADIAGYIVHDPAHLRFFYVPGQPGFVPPFDDPISARLAFPVPGKRDETDPVVNDFPVRIRLFVQEPQNIVKVYFAFLHIQKCIRSTAGQRTMRKPPPAIIFFHFSNIQHIYNQSFNTRTFFKTFSLTEKSPPRPIPVAQLDKAEKVKYALSDSHSPGNSRIEKSKDFVKLLFAIVIAGQLADQDCIQGIG